MNTSCVHLRSLALSSHCVVNGLVVALIAAAEGVVRVIRRIEGGSPIGKSDLNLDPLNPDDHAPIVFPEPYRRQRRCWRSRRVRDGVRLTRADWDINRFGG